MPSQSSRVRRNFMSTPASVQDPAGNLWKDITSTYERARASGAAYKTDTNVELYRDPVHGIEFVLQVAAALRDKPKPAKERHALQSRNLSICHSGKVCALSCFHGVQEQFLRSARNTTDLKVHQRILSAISPMQPRSGSIQCCCCAAVGRRRKRGTPSYHTRRLYGCDTCRKPTRCY